MRTTAALACFLGLTYSAFGETPTQVDIGQNPEQIAELSARVKPISIIDPNRVIDVKGDIIVSTWWLGAKEIIFEPDSRLLFSTGPNSFGQVFVVAGKITVKDPNKPGIITWIKTTPPTPADRGQAGSGASGSGAGAPGAPGAQGAQGVTGDRGQDSPHIMLIVRNVVNGGLVVDFSGGPGGPGGLGQRGGDGGNGAQGGSASTGRISLPFGGWTYGTWCESGPGRGGDGGPGGGGGAGGTGGGGGNGGNITLVSLPDASPVLMQAIRLNMSGGPGGVGGPGGPGARGGAGGLKVR